MNGCSVVLDVGGTEVKSGLFYNGKLLHGETFKAPSQKGLEATLTALAAEIERKIGRASCRERG